MSFVTPLHSRTKVDAAAQRIVDIWHLPEDEFSTALGTEEIGEAIDVVSNWRSAHQWPMLSMRTTLMPRAAHVYRDALVAQRLKRLPAIISKLARFKRMKLSQMQDIGGCRAVLPTVAQAERLVKLSQEGHQRRRPEQPECVETYDYITKPKGDGYRGVHIVLKYHSRYEKFKPLDGLRIELQIRSQLQHTWATTVETVDVITSQALKSNVGDESWKRFFALTGCWFAIRERRPRVGGVPLAKKALIAELRSLKERLNVVPILTGFGSAIRDIAPAKITGSASVLLVLDPAKGELDVKVYGRDEVAEANAAYVDAERTVLRDPKMRAVLVSVASVKALRDAYPNFYLDTTAFIAAVEQATANGQRSS